MLRAIRTDLKEFYSSMQKETYEKAKVNSDLSSDLKEFYSDLYVDTSKAGGSMKQETVNVLNKLDDRLMSALLMIVSFNHQDVVVEAVSRRDAAQGVEAQETRMLMLVPVQVSHEDFWGRYFSRFEVGRITRVGTVNDELSLSSRNDAMGTLKKTIGKHATFVFKPLKSLIPWDHQDAVLESEFRMNIEEIYTVPLLMLKPKAEPTTEEMKESQGEDLGSEFEAKETSMVLESFDVTQETEEIATLPAQHLNTVKLHSNTSDIKGVWDTLKMTMKPTETKVRSAQKEIAANHDKLLALRVQIDESRRRFDDAEIRVCRLKTDLHTVQNALRGKGRRIRDYGRPEAISVRSFGDTSDLTDNEDASVDASLPSSIRGGVSSIEETASMSETDTEIDTENERPAVLAAEEPTSCSLEDEALTDFAVESQISPISVLNKFLKIDSSPIAKLASMSLWTTNGDTIRDGWAMRKKLFT